MRISQIKYLIKEHGENTTLNELLEKVQGKNIYQCPKCKGTGQEEYQTRAANWGYWEAEYGHRDCDLCKGVGYTDVEYKEKMVIEGYEQVK